jgi:hypothetical protein
MDRRLRDSEVKCAADKAEMQAQLIQWQQTAGENLAMLVARQDYADQLERFNEKQDQTLKVLREIRDLAKRKSDPSMPAAR